LRSAVLSKRLIESKLNEELGKNSSIAEDSSVKKPAKDSK